MQMAVSGDSTELNVSTVLNVISTQFWQVGKISKTYRPNEKGGLII